MIGTWPTAAIGVLNGPGQSWEVLDGPDSKGIPVGRRGAAMLFLSFLENCTGLTPAHYEIVVRCLDAHMPRSGAGLASTGWGTEPGEVCAPGSAGGSPNRARPCSWTDTGGPGQFLSASEIMVCRTSSAAVCSLQQRRRRRSSAVWDQARPVIRAPRPVGYFSTGTSATCACVPPVAAGVCGRVRCMR